MVALKKCVLVTGGGGFVGSSLAISFKNKYPDWKVISLDNLRRRGSELNLKRLAEVGIQFVHGDIRCREDLVFENEKIDLILECSAEPSVLAGFNSSPEYVLQANLVGTLNCLEVARRHQADFIFLSTSRVYPYERLNTLNIGENETRFILSDSQNIAGASGRGISEDFPLDGVRSLYGATKLAAELIIQEYVAMYNLRAIINRCGVITGPWQMSRVDQGVFGLWMARHFLKRELAYIGFGGKGKQVRDFVNIFDLFELIDIQMGQIEKLSGKIYNVGGGAERSLSLLETTKLCQEITGNRINIKSVQENRPADVKLYITDYSRVIKDTGWAPKRDATETLTDIYLWIKENEKELKQVLI